MKKMNNKGFSLVELIIVIAIMAILIAVLAPQFLKYVEKSRNSTDIANATEIVTALQTAAADPDFLDKYALADSTVTIPATGSGSATGTFGQEALKAANIAVADITCKSKTRWTAYKIEAKKQADGSLKFEYSQTGGTANAFKNAMSGKSVSSN